VACDQYNEDMLGGWGQAHLENMETFADRDWIQKKTGRVTFGKVKLHTAVASDFMKRQAQIGNLQYILQIAQARPDANIKPIVGDLSRQMALNVNIDEVFPDGGMKQARQDAMRLVTQFLGEGKFTPAEMSDPHPIYIEVFEQALKDPYWQENAPQNRPALEQRLQMQQQMRAYLEQQAELQMQQQMMLANGPGDMKPKGNGNQAPMPNKAPATSGGMNQQLLGASA